MRVVADGADPGELEAVPDEQQHQDGEPGGGAAVDESGADGGGIDVEDADQHGGDAPLESLPLADAVEQDVGRHVAT